ncbi:hypothetical protein BD410DRAFT_387247 [Rickenella mellea]|uniref:F-box domain-containing protein n=1 Tax=Rickenella mellea TaxID=50990 RepID=A0A4Y7PEA4_9AGAM|nr:hypothetical protein BD410DRAFT_387247 [Rickenella mellea]
MPKISSVMGGYSLEILLSLLHRATKCGGKMDEYEIWDFPLQFENDSDNVQFLFKSMKHLRSCKEALDCVRTHLERRIISVQKECIPLAFQDGVKHLPDEILMCIFEFGHQATSSTKFSFDVSHVCRRFRDIALVTPRLWARLHGNAKSAMPMRPELVELLKSRFKQEDVEAIVSIRSLNHFNHYYHERCVIEMASEYSHRWSYLQIDGAIPASPLFPTMPTLS